MKKLAVLMFLFAPIGGAAQNFNQCLERTAARTLAKTTVAVEVKLAKPVYMSDVMFRPVRGKDTVIRTDYKQQTCTGRLSAKKTQVYVPLFCVVNEDYKATVVSITFPNGKKIHKSGNNVEYQEKTALIRI